MDDEATTIHDVVPEVLIKIFKKLEADSDLRNVKHTCHRWFELIDKRVGRKVAVRGRGLSFTSALEPLSKIGLQSCSILQEDEDSDDETENPEARTDEWKNALEGLKYPYLLNDLYLHGSLPPDAFAKLAKPARNLSSFEITLFTLSKVRNDDLKNLPFPKLKELKVNCFDDDPGFLPSLQTLLTENRFPRLTHLSFDLPGTPSKDFSIMGSLIIFVQDHHSLQALNLDMDMTLDEGSAPPAPVPFPNLELKAIISDIRKRGDCHLRKLDICIHASDPDPTHGFSFPAVIEILQEFLRNVVSLESLMMALEPIPSYILQGICTRNGATLKVLHIGSGRSLMDCSVFASLKVCQMISIASHRHGAIGLRHLPPTLSSFSIWGPIGQADAEHVLFNLPKLQEVGLYWQRSVHFPSSRDGTCVTLDMLRRFCENRRVDKLQLSNDCLADPESFPVEGIPNNDPVNRAMLEIRVLKSVPGLYWKLNEQGFYTTGWNQA